MILHLFWIEYRQVNGVDIGGYNVFAFVCLSVRKWLTANEYQYSNTFKATDLKSDLRIPRDSPDMTPYKIFENGAWPFLCMTP